MMTKRRTRILPLFLAAVLLCSLFLLPPTQASAEEDPARYPTVFVHGWIGWGSYDGLDRTMPYWGLTTGSIISDLNSRGYDCYAASVGPFSSAWDRACELYAQITGTRTDYGIAHSQKYGHDRYGRDFTGKGLIPNFTWDSNHKINLVGHSFGGATSRMLIDLLYDGAPEEVEASRAAGETVSPLFSGGHSGMVYSLTTISAPFNGSTFHYSSPIAVKVFPELFKTVGTGIDATGTGLYDPMLDQFGIGYDPNKSLMDTLNDVFESDFMSHNDNAVHDLSIMRTTDLNKTWELRPDIYYFAHYGNKTPADPLAGGVAPAADMIPTMIPFSYEMCKYTGVTDSYYIDGYGSYERTVSVPVVTLDEEWQPNDCIVNVISARCPFYLKADGTKVYDAHVDYQEGMTYPKGKWTIFPAHNLDHIGIIGGFFMESADEVHGLFRDVMATIHDTASSGGNSGSGIEPGCPTAQFTDMDHNGWYHTFIDYVVKNGLMNGTSATTFSPDAKVTRGMVAQTLYAMEGKPAYGTDAPFSDVPSDRYYAAAIKWCAANGIVSGYEDGTFHPDENITRQQLATMLYAFAGYKGKDRSNVASLSGYADAGDVAYYAQTPMGWAVASGLIDGRQTEQGKRLCPNETAMRSELAVLLMNLKEKIL